MNNLTDDDSFPAPKIPAADPVDGLIPVAALASPLQMEITLRRNVTPGNWLQIMLDGAEYGGIRYLTENERPGDTIVLLLDKDALATDGNYSLGYWFVNEANSVKTHSDTVSVLVDRTAPGATFLAPVIFHHITLGDMLHGTIPGYAGMEPGDVIQTICNGVEGPALVTSPDHLTKHPIRITFERPFLDSLNSESVRISYHVTDRAGNRSVDAQAVDLTYQRSMPAN